MKRRQPSRRSSHDLPGDTYEQLLAELRLSIEATRPVDPGNGEPDLSARLSRFVEVVDDTLTILAQHHLQQVRKVETLDRLLHDLEERQRLIELLIGEDRYSIETKVLSTLNRWIREIEAEVGNGGGSSNG
jgi:hypothetical protein